MTSRYMVCDVFDGLASLEPASVDLIVTSPPFLALRSYLPADHEHKAKELGSEATPGEYLDRMLDVVEACARVLAPHGSLVFELGDTYANDGGPSGDSRGIGLMSGSWNGAMPPEGPRNRLGKGWPLQKSKVLIPQLFAVALAYGFNPLTGRQTEPWRVRNTVAWCRPNPPVGRDGDKFRPATSFLTVACKARDRYWDGDAVRSGEQSKPGGSTNWHPNDGRDRRGYDELGGQVNTGSHPAGAPLLDYWTIPTAPYKGAHYATYPPDLVVPLVKSMCPQRVCRVCGVPSRRIVGEARYEGRSGPITPPKWASGNVERGRPQDAAGMDSGGYSVIRETLGWSDCGHNSWRSGLVLDPFAGSGTTLAVASGHGLDSIGFDLDSRNAELARERVGMFLDIESAALSSGSDTR